MFLLVLAIALVLQVTLLEHLRIGGVKLDLLLVAVIFYGLYRGRNKGFLIGGLAGLLKDTASVGTFGVNTGLFALCGWAVGVYSGRIYRDNFFNQAVLTFLISLVASISYLFLHADFHINYYPSLLIGAFYNAALAPLVFSVLGSRFSVFGNKPTEHRTPNTEHR